MEIIKYGAACAAVFVLLCSSAVSEEFSLKKDYYVCPPCPHVTDIFATKQYSHDGQCSVCGMNLIELHHPETNNLAINDDSLRAKLNLHTGSGNFNFVTVKGINISVFYYKPKHFNSDSKILLVIPGAGRGGLGVSR